MDSPQVGTLVHFYPHGQRNQRPWAAIVTYEGTDGCCKLTIFPANSAPVFSDRLHHYAGDPWVQDNIRFLARFDGPCPCGSWDWLTANEKRQEKRQEKPPANRREIGRQKVREYAEQGLTPREIAPKVRQYGINSADVEEEVSDTLQTLGATA